MSELIGYAIPVWFEEKNLQMLASQDLPKPDLWEHTYVISSKDDRWGCFGRSKGGREICRGRGDLEAAKCLARDGCAGIIYGFHGVCHQIANRIMWPARIRVTTAKGYTIFSQIYGHYGRLSKWHERSECLGDHDDMPSFEHQSGGLHESAGHFDFSHSAPSVIYGMHSDLDESATKAPVMPGSSENDDGRVQALREAINDRLGTAFDREKRKQVLAIQIESLGPQDELALAFENKKTSAETYFQEFSKLHRDCLKKFESVLGREDFIRLFDFPLEDVPPPADPELFARAHGLTKPPKLPD